MLKINPTTTKRLNIFKKMAVSRKAERSIIPYVQKNIEKIENPTLKEGMACAFNYFSKKKGKVNQLRVLQVDDIIQKYNQCKDEEIQKEIEDCADWLIHSTKRDKPQILDLMNGMLDAINVSNEQYSNLYRINFFDSFNLINIIRFKLLKRPNLLENAKETVVPYKELLYSEPRDLNKKLKSLGKEANIDSPEYKNFAKFSALKDFIIKYSHNQPEAVNFLYERTYLTKQDKSVQNYTNRIQNNTGVKILDYTTGVIPEKKLYKTEKELEMFHSLINEDEAVTNFLEINPIDFAFITGCSGGYNSWQRFSHHITLPEWVENRELRHELVHSVDKSLHDSTQVNSHISTLIKKDLQKVGAPEYAIEYANTNEREAKAVLGEYYSDKFSQETKDFMVEKGLPPQILKLKDVDFYDLLIKHRSFNDKELETIEEIRTRFDGIVPEKIYDCIVKEPVFEIKKVVELTKGKDNIKPEDFVEIFEALTNLERLKSDKNYLENGIRFKREIPRGITCLDNIIDSPRQMRTLIHKYEIEIERAEYKLEMILERY